jgi:hypothetical protein
MRRAAGEARRTVKRSGRTIREGVAPTPAGFDSYLTPEARRRQSCFAAGIGRHGVPHSSHESTSFWRPDEVSNE